MPATCVVLSVDAAATPATYVAWLQAGVGGLLFEAAPVVWSKIWLVVFVSFAVRSGWVPSMPASTTAMVTRLVAPTSNSQPAGALTWARAYCELNRESFGTRLAR